ncbi:hypothetical protein [Streptomyces sp. NPDC004008]
MSKPSRRSSGSGSTPCSSVTKCGIHAPEPRSADNVSGLASCVASGLCVGLMPERLRDILSLGIAFVALRGQSPHLATTVVAVRRPEADAAVLRLLKPLPRGNSG